MHTDLIEKIRPKTSNLVVALFADSQAAHGALADLRDAGFSNGQISIAFSAEGRQAQLGKTEAHSIGQHAVSEKRNAWSGSLGEALSTICIAAERPR